MSAEDADDAWSYSFPPSTESLTLTEPKVFSNPSQALSKLQQLHDDQQALASGNDENDADNDADIGSTISGDSGELRNLKDRHRLTVQTMTKSSSLSSLSLQSPFLPKSTPADPHTTRHDANYILSGEENGRSDSSRNLSSLKNRAIEQEVSLENGQDASNGSLQSPVTTPSAPKRSGSVVGKSGPSPKIISYRKSKRTTSDGSYGDVMSPELTKDYDSRLYLDEFFKDSPYRYAVMKRNIDYHQLFRSLDLTDRFLDDFSCALSREILLQGRIYISEHYVCFNSNLLGWVTNIIIPMEDIVKFEKKTTAGLFPNGIIIETKDMKYIFASFISRDATYDFMKLVWQETTGNKSEDDELNENDDVNDENDLTTPKIESYIMSIDGDDFINDKSDNEGDEGAHPKQVEEELTTKILKFKEESKYKNMGPDLHAPTSAEGKFTPDANEVELFNETFDAPLGVVYDILFGSSNTSFHRKCIEEHDGSEITDYGLFRPMEDDPTKLERTYTYRKALGYSIGPKSTKCEVSEVIEHLNFADYIIVLSTTVTPDVPLGNSFSVKTRYVFTWGPQNQTNLKLSFYNEWTGRSWIKTVIDKQSLSGQQDAANDLLVALREEITKHTYFIDGPTIVQTTTAPEEEEISRKPAAITKAEPETKPSVSISPMKNNLVSVVSVMGILILLLFALQIRIYSMVQSTNSLVRQQMLVNSHLLSERSTDNLFEVYPDEFWDVVTEKFGKKLTREERVEYLLKQLNHLYIEGNEKNAGR